MRYSTTSLSLAALALASSARALSTCAIFDTDWNLYLLGGSSDVSLGGSESWGSPSAKDLPTSGRPPYTGGNLTCHLSQYNNAFYLLGADSSNPSDVYIYNVDSSSWSKQATSGAPSFESAGTILDHDTNTFFTLTGKTMSQLDLSAVSDSATGDSIAWSEVGASAIDSSSYIPTMALASNHIMFHGVPDVSAGSADIFVIHYSAWQASAQAFPSLNDGAAFPDSHGQATSFWLDSTDAQLQYAFVPDDFSSTYVITHWTSPSTAGSTEGAPAGIQDYINSTQVLPAPTEHDVQASYAASDVALVQLTSAGVVSYLPAFSSAGGYAVDASATWTKIDYTLPGASGASSGLSSSVAGSASTSASESSTTSAGSPTGSAVSPTSSAVSASLSRAGASSASASASAAAGGDSSGAQSAVELSGLRGLALTAFVGLGAAFFL